MRRGPGTPFPTLCHRVDALPTLGSVAGKTEDEFHALRIGALRARAGERDAP